MNANRFGKRRLKKDRDEGRDLRVLQQIAHGRQPRSFVATGGATGVLRRRQKTNHGLAITRYSATACDTLPQPGEGCVFSRLRPAKSR